jgi:hypothetical protein
MEPNHRRFRHWELIAKRVETYVQKHKQNWDGEDSLPHYFIESIDQNLKCLNWYGDLTSDAERSNLLFEWLTALRAKQQTQETEAQVLQDTPIVGTIQTFFKATHSNFGAKCDRLIEAEIAEELFLSAGVRMSHNQLMALIVKCDRECDNTGIVPKFAARDIWRIVERAENPRRMLDGIYRFHSLSDEKVEQKLSQVTTDRAERFAKPVDLKVEDVCVIQPFPASIADEIRLFENEIKEIKDRQQHAIRVERLADELCGPVTSARGLNTWTSDATADESEEAMKIVFKRRRLSDTSCPFSAADNERCEVLSVLVDGLKKQRDLIKQERKSFRRARIKADREVQERKAVSEREAQSLVAVIENYEWRDSFHSLNEFCEAQRYGSNNFKSFSVEFLFGKDIILAWTENCFDVNFASSSAPPIKINEQTHPLFYPRLNSSADDGFMVCGIVPGTGSCGPHAVCAVLASLGVPRTAKDIRHDIVQCAEDTFIACDDGLLPILLSDELSYLASFSMLEVEALAVEPITAATDKTSAKYLNAVAQFRAHMAECRKATTWIDTFTLKFLPMVLKRSVWVYSVDLHYWSEYPPLEPSALEPIHLLMVGDHFAPLITNKALREKRWEGI